MAEFVFAWFYDEEMEQDILVVSEKDFFEETGAQSSTYENDVYNELMDILDELGLDELSEGYFELSTSTKADITAALLETGKFERSEEFQEFIGE